MSLQYNPLENNFTVYEAVETPKVEYKLPLSDSPLDSDWINDRVSGISSSGSPIVKPNTSNAKMIMDRENNQSTTSVDTTVEYQPSLSLDGKKKKAMDFFIGKGLKTHQAAAIIGNLIGESNLNENAVNPSSKAYGLAQWLGSRKTKLLNKYGKKPTFDQQLEFLWDELQSDERPAFTKLLSTTDIDSATKSFMMHFERPSVAEQNQSIAKRIKNAKSLLA